MTDQFRNITFPPENDGFFAELREEVNAYFKKSGKSIYGNTSMYLKIACLFLVYVFVFSIPFIFPVEPSHLFLCYSFLGIWGVFLGVNVGHDAAHNSLFKTKKYNQWFMYIFDLMVNLFIISSVVYKSFLPIVFNSYNISLLSESISSLKRFLNISKSLFSNLIFFSFY